MAENVYSQQKSLSLTQPCIKRFFLNVNIGIIYDWVKICSELRIKLVKVFKNDHSMLACQFWNLSYLKSVEK